MSLQQPCGQEVRDRFLFQQRFETQMRALADGLNKREVPGDTTKVLQRVGRL
ncbi:MAG: hypothetical protein IPP22_16780 [Nitrosomonas sp.]|nr:hypothetical protein [Nitrosomonas sp.]